jgi:hypothetical protein
LAIVPRNLGLFAPAANPSPFLPLLADVLTSRRLSLILEHGLSIMQL